MQDAETGKGRCMSMQAMQTLYDLRENNQLCDAIIVLDDGTEIPIHRALLCACSSYFKAAFTTLLHNKTETKVQIPGVSSDMMHILLKYAYLRKLDLNKNNVYDVLITADYLSMLGALEMCCSFLEGMIDPKNCIGILLFARNHFCNELSQIAWRFIMKNFIQVAQQSEELLLLSLKEFQEIINSDNLNVKSEEIVWETILKWINHEPEQRKGHIVSLMKCIRLGLLETQFFMERVKDHPYVAACEESRPMVIETLKFLYDLERIMHKPYMARKHGLPLSKCDFSLMVETDPSPHVYIMKTLKELCALEPDSQPLREKWRNARGIKDCSKNLISPFDNDLRWERNSERVFPAFKLFNYRRRNGEVVTPEIARPRLPHEVLFAIGGWSGGSPTNYIETYDTRADRWVKIDEVDPSGPRAYHGTAVVGYSIYVIGGFDGMDYFNSCRCFDPVRKTWKEIAPMHARRCYVSTAVLNDIIYAMGGYDGHHRQNTAEKYDYRTNQWSLIASMNMQRSDASACSLNNKIYITGGFNGQECMHSAEVYDPDVNQWTLIAAMRSRRSGVSCISYHDYVYVIGGFNGISRMCSGEKYNPHTNTWTPVPDMYNPRSNFAIEVIDDMIFAIGGFNGVTTIYHVECYDEKTNEWYEATDMNIYRSALSACVVDGLPNIGDYIHKHRDKLMEEKRQKMIALENQRQGAGGNVPNPPNPPENVITAAHGNLQQLNILQQLNNNNDVNNNQNQVVPVAQDQPILMELDEADNDA